MTELRCSEVLSRVSEFLVNEVDAPQADAMAAHFESCPECAMALAAERRLDQLVVQAVDEAAPPSSGLRNRIRAEIAGPVPRRVRWWRFAAVSGSVATLVLGAGLWYGAAAWQTHLLCADAADDHKSEIVDRQPRRWRTSRDEIGALAQRVGAAAGDVPQVIESERLTLNRGRICQLRGVRFLHLVYGGGSREVSVFIAPDAAGKQAVDAVVHQEHDLGIDVSTFRSGGLVVVVASDLVTSLSNQVAAELAHQM